MGENGKLTNYEKEMIMIERLKDDDMVQFNNIMPYQLNCPLKKFIREGGHPFAYIDLNPFNQYVATEELKRLDEYIVKARDYIPILTKEYHIDIKKVMLSQYSESYGYTRLMCTPYTFTGKISKYPLSLFFTSRLDVHTYSVHGEMVYNKSGALGKATVNIWKLSTGWFFDFGVYKGDFVLSKAKTTLRPDKYGQPTVVYDIKEAGE